MLPGRNCLNRGCILSQVVKKNLFTLNETVHIGDDIQITSALQVLYLFSFRSQSTFCDLCILMLYVNIGTPANVEFETKMDVTISLEMKKTAQMTVKVTKTFYLSLLHHFHLLFAARL